MTLVRARRVLVIANPAAGLGRAKDAGLRSARAATASGAKVELALTHRPGEALGLARAAAEARFDLVVAAGGDGTVNEVANGVAGTGVALAVAPAGTMNLLARLLRLPLEPGAAVERVVAGYRPLAFRPGIAADRLFVLMAGCGFDAWVLRELRAGSSGKIGFSDYVRGAVSGLRKFPFPRLTIEHDGSITRGHTAVVGRAPLYGGFLRPTPGADFHVDALQLCAIDGGPLRLLALVPRMFSGAHEGVEGVTLVPAQRVAIAADVEDAPYQLDGELAGTLPVAIALSPRVLILAAPEGLA